MRWGLAAAFALVVLIVVSLGLQERSDHGGTQAKEERVSERSREQLAIARHLADRRSRDGLEKSIAAYQSTLALDPDSAEAYSGLALSYALLGIYDYWRPREAFEPAQTLATRALELDPTSAEARLAAGLVAAVGRWDWSGALEGSRLALEADPRSAEAWYWRGALLSALGRHREAIDATRRALELEPTSPVVNTALAWHLFRARRYDEAITQAHRAVDLFPDYYDAWDNLKWIQMTVGNETVALEAWVRAEDLLDGDGESVRRAYRIGGLEAVHRKAIETKSRRWESGRYQSPYDVALEWAALGEPDEALVWLERSYAERETDLVDLGVDPRLDPLRSTRAFADLLSRLAFPPPELPADTDLSATIPG